MPELPEVETVRRGLERTILGKVVADVVVCAPKIFAESPEAIDRYLVGAQIGEIERRAKLILVRLSNDWTLAIHLKMTGQLVVVGPSTTGFVAGHPEKVYNQPLPHKHTHVIITFTDGTQLFFNDLRKFGWMRLYPAIPIEDYLTLDAMLRSLKLGPEPLSSDFTIDYFTGLVKGRAVPIKTLLLEQKGISGIGNIYADEALFMAEISPLRKANSLMKDEIVALHKAIRQVLTLGIKHGGTTVNTYRNVDGTQGKMRDHLKVYGREGQPCVRCGALIERMKIGQRSAHFCPACQRGTHD